jgi:hypothetical protein
LLGEDHDLHMLQLFIEQENLPIARAKRERIVALCSDMQTALRTKAETAGRHLYAEPVDAFARRLKRYWSLAVEFAPPAKQPSGTAEASEPEPPSVPVSEAAD